jgi:sarcosine oxidase subunit gamma
LISVVEPYLRRSPLAGRNLAARPMQAPGDAGVMLGERPHRAMVNLRGDPADPSFVPAASKAAGVPLPVVPNTTSTDGEVTALWLGPNEWLLIGPDGRAGHIAGRLRAGLAAMHVAVTDVSEARTTIAVAGPRARDLLSKGTPLDLHPRVFGMGKCAQTVMAKANVILRQADERPTFEVLILNSFADYLFSWLERAGAEYGVAVAAP